MAPGDLIDISYTYRRRCLGTKPEQLYSCSIRHGPSSLLLRLFVDLFSWIFWIFVCYIGEVQGFFKREGIK